MTNFVHISGKPTSISNQEGVSSNLLYLLLDELIVFLPSTKF